MERPGVTVLSDLILVPMMLKRTGQIMFMNFRDYYCMGFFMPSLLLVLVLVLLGLALVLALALALVLALALALALP